MKSTSIPPDTMHSFRSRSSSFPRHSQRSFNSYPDISKLQSLPCPRLKGNAVKCEISTTSHPSVEKSVDVEKTSGTAGRLPVVVPSLGTNDIYGIFCGVVLGPWYSLVYVYLLFTLVPFCALSALYGWFLRKPSPRVKRNATFSRFIALVLFVSIPAIPIILLNILLTAIMSVVLCIPYGVVVLGCGQISHNYEMLRPFRLVGPWSIHDVICAIIGAQHRQSFFRFLHCFVCMLTFDPFLKWFMMANPFLHRLEEHHGKQWTPNLVDMNRDEVSGGLYRSISYALHVDRTTQSIDNDRFSAHYQIPSEETKPVVFPKSGGVSGQPAVGYQYSNTLSHFMLSSHPKDGLYVPKSTTGNLLVYSMLFSYYNPFHILTGYGEVNIRSGNSIEQALWCIQGNHCFAASTLESSGKLFFGYSCQQSQDGHDDAVDVSVDTVIPKHGSDDDEASVV